MTPELSYVERYAEESYDALAGLALGRWALLITVELASAHESAVLAAAAKLFADRTSVSEDTVAVLLHHLLSTLLAENVRALVTPNVLLAQITASVTRRTVAHVDIVEGSAKARTHVHQSMASKAEVSGTVRRGAGVHVSTVSLAAVRIPMESVRVVAVAKMSLMIVWRSVSPMTTRRNRERVQPMASNRTFVLVVVLRIIPQSVVRCCRDGLLVVCRGDARGERAGDCAGAAPDVVVAGVQVTRLVRAERRHSAEF